MGTIKYHLERSDVYLIFDRYIGNSTKQMARSSRSGNDASRKDHLSLRTIGSQRSAQQGTTDCFDMSVFLINHIQGNQTKLVITEKDPRPVQVWKNSTLQREDLKTNH